MYETYTCYTPGHGKNDNNPTCGAYDPESDCATNYPYYLCKG
jgi:hypothetical protein